MIESIHDSALQWRHPRQQLEHLTEKKSYPTKSTYVFKCNGSHHQLLTSCLRQVSSKYLELTRQKLELTRLPHENSDPQSKHWWEPKPIVEPLIDFWYVTHALALLLTIRMARLTLTPKA